MTRARHKTKDFRVLIPLVGACFFICLYVMATFLYPGGSQLDKNSKGFSWADNYWCNLLNKNAINGEYNPARPVALASMVILGFTLGAFWYIFPQHINFKRRSRVAIQISGLVSMATGTLICTGLHDTIINITGLCAVIAIAGTFAGLHILKWKGLFWLGIFNLLLVAVNNILYYGNGLKLYLPVVQKITFLFFLLWLCLIDINLYNRKVRN